MVYKPTAREIRVSEYKICIEHWKEVERFLNWLIVATLAGHGALLTIFQATFPRESTDISRYLTSEHPGFVIIQLIPNVGMLLVMVLFVGVLDWMYRRNKIIKYGIWLEFNMKIVNKGGGHGFFANVITGQVEYWGRVIVPLIIVFIAGFAWISIQNSVTDILIGLHGSKRVVTEPISGTKVQMPTFKIEKGERK